MGNGVTTQEGVDILHLIHSADKIQLTSVGVLV